MNQRRLYSAKTVAALLDMPVRTFYANCEAMGLRPLRLVRGSRAGLRWPAAEVEAYLGRITRERAEEARRRMREIA